MLEVRNLRKEYKSKQGVVTKALDGVSLTFPETGMVFILGKSGSGKSTLLNVCGGLDRMDSGEIIIKGKSSDEFSSQDFDSYRNTYVGFVFQEYNILDEFTVEQNIALALELQNKKPDKDVIARILADVDMTEFASRKPNTLSGGQKQRVAIARALVKEPEIIMADEPTGALDSKTGQQVFDTLKKLSASKLVLVISHDRDFAEQYGDRIIELKDGKVISDQARAADDGTVKNVRFYGTDTVCVTNGAEITDDELVKIKEFLSKAGGSAVISTSREQIAQFKENKPEISVGTFENIGEQPKSKQYEPQKLIRSHLPVKHAIKMGASSLKTKPVRLVFTILLSLVAFVLFGLASTLMLFDGHSVKVQTFTDSNISHISLGKVYSVTERWSEDDSYTSDNDTKFTDAEYKAIAERYHGALAAIPFNTSISNISLGSSASNFYSESVYFAVAATDELNILAGRKPQAEDEIAITDFMFDSFKSSGTKFVYGEATQLTLSEYTDILWSNDKDIRLRLNNNFTPKIVGVFKGMEVPNDYKSMKDAADHGNEMSNGMSTWTWQQELRGGMYATIALDPEAFASVAESNTGGNNDNYRYFQYSDKSAELTRGENSYDLYSFSKLEGKTYPAFDIAGQSVTSLLSGEIALHFTKVAGFYYDAYLDFKGSLESDEEYQAMLEAAKAEARVEYEAAHRRPNMNDPEFIRQDEYDQAVAEWQVDFEAFKTRYAEDHPENLTDDQLKDVYIYEYHGNWYPDISNYREENKYYRAEQEYNNAMNAYAEEQILELRKNKKYYEKLSAARQKAEAEFRAENPEPNKNADPNTWDQWNAELEWRLSMVTPLDELADLRYNSNYSLKQVKDVFADAAYVLSDMGTEDKPWTDIELTMKSEINSERAVKLVGYFYSNNYSDAAYLGADLFDTFYVERSGGYDYTVETDYVEPADAYIANIFVPYDHSEAMIEELLKLDETRNSDSSAIKIKNAVMSSLNSIIEIASTLEKVFIIAGAVLALFAFLLMFNFISASITAKKKDIGILRAIGARTIDVFKIFVSEALIVALICFALSTAGTFGLCMLINSIIMNDAGLSVSLFVFGPLSVLCILGIALLTSIVSTVIPVAIYSRKPPIASIRAL